MIKEFEKRIEHYEKGKDKFLLLSDYEVLGEELAIIKALAEQLTLYSTIQTCKPNRNERENLLIPVDTLWGFGQGMIRLVEKLEGKIQILDERFFLEGKGEKNGQVPD
ncbi:MAG: hypothetical protein OEV42_09860 [Deltaproteobacteria bacterium]|nr:hypothetical protein [Deltaproteobacteria bacterium]